MVFLHDALIKYAEYDKCRDEAKTKAKKEKKEKKIKR